MPTWSTVLNVVPASFLAILGLVATPATAQNPAPLQIVSITAGPAGVQSNGTFVLSEQRSIFSRETDREVYVVFQWEGTPGPHKLVAVWRSPDGGMTSTSAIDYVATDKRFGARWQLTIGPSMPVGQWSIDATVDGQPAGRHTFEVRDERVEPAVAKRPALSQSELYDRLNRVFVMIQRTDPAGAATEVGGGVLADGGIYTAVGVLDEAAAIRVRTATAAQIEIGTVLALNREEGWAVLPGDTAHAPGLAAAPEGSIAVGNRCYSIESSASGGRALTNCTVSGRQPGSRGDNGFIVRFNMGPGTPGAPVVNEFGELLGLVGANGMRVEPLRLSDVHSFSSLPDAPLIAIRSIRVSPGSVAETIATLEASGVLLTPLVGSEDIVSGGFARRLSKSNLVAPADQKDTFSAGENTFFVFVNWLPAERVKGTCLLRVYDASNHLIGESQPGKADYRKGQLTLSTWQLPIPPNPGAYRVDVLFNDKPVWRGTVHVTP